LTDNPLSLAFFDRERGLHGSLRAGMSLLFEGKSPTAVPEAASVSPDGAGWSASLGDRLSLSFEPCSEAADLGGASARVCRVRGKVGSATVEGLGTAVETRDPPRWAELDALRSVSAIFDEQNAVLSVARRPRGALGHGDERVTAWLLSAGDLLAVEDARLSTVYDGEGRQRAAGLELWLPGEDFPRRASGIVEAGTTLAMEGLVVNASVFSWEMEGRSGVGAYDVTHRDEPQVA
jgi:hypothetical protein